ncbi:hypothetical protein [Geodermatophilus sp. SYSU D00079]
MTALPAPVLIWQFGGKPGNLTAQNSYTAHSGYNLFCQPKGAFLTYGEQPAGINLAFTTNPQERKVHLRLPDGQEREVLTGEPVSFGIGGGDAFLHYAERTAGINLKWSGSPRPEWLVWGATGEPGRPIPTGTPVALLNVNVKPAADFLVHLDRHPGVADVGWTTSPNWWGSLGKPLAGLVAELVL